MLLPTLRGTTALLSPLQHSSSALAAAVVHPVAGDQTRREGFEELLREGELEGIGQREEIDIIAPAVSEANGEGYPVAGPFPAEAVSLVA